MEYVTVRDEAVPAIGLGTYRLDGNECFETVQTALELGYRHIDTAEMYDNQSEIGDAIATTSIARDELFVTTKVWKTNLEHDAVHRSVAASLEALGFEYLDLLLIHWPNDDVPVEETLGAMNQLQADGRVRHIGVSNFSRSQLEEAIAVSETPIVTNQVKYHPYVDRDDLLQFCSTHDVMLTAYSPLAEGRIATDDTLRTIGDRYGKSPTQVALRWLTQQDDVIAIPKASSLEHLQSNIQVFDFELTPEEMDRIFAHRGGLLYQVRNTLGI